MSCRTALLLLVCGLLASASAEVIMDMQVAEVMVPDGQVHSLPGGIRARCPSLHRLEREAEGGYLRMVETDIGQRVTVDFPSRPLLSLDNISVSVLVRLGEGVGHWFIFANGGYRLGVVAEHKELKPYVYANNGRGDYFLTWGDTVRYPLFRHRWTVLTFVAHRTGDLELYVNEDRIACKSLRPYAEKRTGVMPNQWFSVMPHNRKLITDFKLTADLARVWYANELVSQRQLKERVRDWLTPYGENSQVSP